jgi:hypothetical protein
MSTNDPAADWVDFGAVAVDSLFLNSLPLLINNAIIDTGQTVSKTDQTQTSRAMSHYAANGTFYVDSGTVNIYTLNPIVTNGGTNKVPAEYLDGMEATFVTPNANTGTATASVVGTGVAKPIVQSDFATPLIANAIPASRMITLRFKKSVDSWILISANGGSSGTMTRPIGQTTHGLAVGNVVRLNGSGNYILAIADSEVNAEIVGVVSGVADADNFTLTVGGFISGLSGLTAGVVMFLSATVAGTLTSSEPTGNTQISKPVLVADTATSGYLKDFRGIINQDQEETIRRKNVLINGNFDLWQRGTTTTTDFVFLADRWATTDGAGSYTVSRQEFALGQTDVPDNPQFFLRHNQSVAAPSTNPAIFQRIENVRTFAGQTITISFWAKANTAISVFPDFVQHFGSGGSPSSDVVNPGTVLNVTTVWQRFTETIQIPSIAGKIVGTDLPPSDNLAIVLRLPAGITFIFDLSSIQIEKGNIATEFERRPVDHELALAQRYYFKTFRQQTTPAQNLGSPELDHASSASAGSNGSFALITPFPVRMRATPAVTTFNPQAANNQIRNIDDATDTPTATQIGERRVLVFPGVLDATDANDGMYIHVTADAEL